MLHKSTAVSASHVPSVSLFAQLLASERLTIRVDRDLTTAAFIPEKRVLLLPSWSGFDEASWLLFVAHEVGHALFTPADAITTHPAWQRLSRIHGETIVRNVLNVFEDIRIERLIRAKYRGLAGVFSRGYYSLLSRSFFGFAPDTLTPEIWDSKLTLDRVNLYAKAGALLRVNLTASQEIAWYNRALRLDTYEQVMTLVEEVILSLNEQQKRQASQTNSTTYSLQPSKNKASQSSKNNTSQSSQPNASQDNQSAQDSASQSAQDNTSQSSQDSTSQSSQDNQSAQDSASPSSQSSQDESTQGPTASAESESESPSQSNTAADPFKIASQQAATDQLRKSASNGRYETREHVILPVNTAFLHYNDVTVEQMLEAWKAPDDIRALFRTLLQQQRREQSSILASMIATFRANQSAWQSRRVQVSKSGALDTTKLAQYKLVEDLFLRRQSLPEAQNHGFVIHVDWSGSMDIRMSVVLWQVLHLIWFAESIKVPISVYGFSNSGQDTEAFKEYRLRANHVPNGRLLELYRSNASAQTKQDAQAFLLALTARFAGFSTMLTNLLAYGERPGAFDTINARAPRALVPVLRNLIPTFAGWGTGDVNSLTQILQDTFYHSHVAMGGTPLWFALYSSIDIVRKFRQTHRVEQCISVWLTDGEDTDNLPIDDKDIQVPGHSRYWGGRYCVRPLTLIDPRSGRKFESAEGRILPLLFDLHRTLTGATVVCIDITSNPLHSLRRIVSKDDLRVIANQVGDVDQYSSRRRSSRVKPKQLKQNRTRVILPQTDGRFDETGLLLVSRKQYAQIGCDAYLVSHPDWWTNPEVGVGRVEAAVDDVFSRSHDADAEFIDDESNDTQSDDEQEWDRAQDAWDRAQDADDAAAKRFIETDGYRAAPVKLKTALLEQHATVAMRRFADLLVPYMAIGRDDASVR